MHLHPTTSIRTRILKAGSWSLIGHVASQAIRLGSSLVMTRLLMPEAFGVMAIANVILFGIALFSDLGLRQNIIQSQRGNDPIFLNTAWSVQIIRGVGLCVIGMLVAAAFYLLAQLHFFPAESVYSEPVLPWVIGALSIVTLINSFESTKLASANRNLALGQVTLIELTSQIIGILLMLAWVYADRSIWALVAGGVVSSIVKTALSHVVLPGEKNKLYWDAQSFHEIFHFGKWIFLTSVMGFLISSLDRLLLGGMIPAEELGVYSIAVLLAGAFQELVSKLIGSVALPALGEINRLQPTRIKELYYKIRLPIDLFCLTSAGILFTSGNAIVDLLYDSRYAQAGSILSILSLSLLAYRYGVAGQLYIALGKPKLVAFIMIFRLCMMVLFIPAGFQINGLIGATWGITLACLSELVITLAIKRKLRVFDLRNELKTLPLFLAGLAIGWLLTYILQFIS